MSKSDGRIMNSQMGYFLYFPSYAECDRFIRMIDKGLIKGWEIDWASKDQVYLWKDNTEWY